MSVTEDEQMVSYELAEHNLENVELLFSRLRAAAESAGRTSATIARLMGLDVDTVENILAGEVDLTISDLQELSLAIGAHLGFDVQGDVNHDLQELKDEALMTAMSAWQESALDPSKIKELDLLEKAT